MRLRDHALHRSILCFNITQNACSGIGYKSLRSTLKDEDMFFRDLQNILLRDNEWRLTVNTLAMTKESLYQQIQQCFSEETPPSSDVQGISYKSVWSSAAS